MSNENELYTWQISLVQSTNKSNIYMSLETHYLISATIDKDI